MTSPSFIRVREIRPGQGVYTVLAWSTPLPARAEYWRDLRRIDQRNLDDLRLHHGVRVFMAPEPMPLRA